MGGSKHRDRFWSKYIEQHSVWNWWLAVICIPYTWYRLTGRIVTLWWDCQHEWLTTPFMEWLTVIINTYQYWLTCELVTEWLTVIVITQWLTFGCLCNSYCDGLREWLTGSNNTQLWVTNTVNLKDWVTHWHLCAVEWRCTTCLLYHRGLLNYTVLFARCTFCTFFGLLSLPLRAALRPHSNIE